MKVFGTDSTLPDLVSWNKYTTHLFFKVYINRQKHRFCCQAIPSFPFNSSHETWVTEDAPELEFFFSGEPITSAPACKMMSFFWFFLGRHSNLFKKYVLSPVQSILFCMDSFRPSRAATVGRTRMTENSHGALPIPRRFVKGQLGVSKLEHVKTMLH